MSNLNWVTTYAIHVNDLEVPNPEPPMYPGNWKLLHTCATIDLLSKDRVLYWTWEKSEELNG